MKILKREIIYTCEIERTNTKSQKQITEIECDNKGVLKRASGIIGNDSWQILKEEVSKQFKKRKGTKLKIVRV